MKKYQPTDISQIYKQLLCLAKKENRKGAYEKSLKYLSVAAEWAYSFNSFYTDLEAEKLLSGISDATVPKVFITTPEPKRIVYLDSWCIDNRGLSQQYLRAMIKNGLELLYISVANNLEKGSGLLEELRLYDKASIRTFENHELTEIEKASCIAKMISEFSPEHIILHITPWEIPILMACRAVSGVCVMNVNLTDHAYWMGASFINYNIDFRPYGETISIEKRNLDATQIIRLPFYPITPQNQSFDGLPELPVDCIKVFTGGVLYKMMGKDDIFFRLMDAVLGISSKIFIIVAGFNHDKRFDKKCAMMKHGDRVVQVGIRTDIDAVFDHVDIFLGTYPMTGGLMCQYAAKHGLPIVAYHDKNDVMNYVEEFVNHNQGDYKSFSNFDELIKYVEKLIIDENYRKTEGEKLKKALMTEDIFSLEFSNLIKTHKSSWPLEIEDIDYNAFFERYLDLENCNGYSATKKLVARLKWKVMRIKGYRTNFLKLFLVLLVGKIKPIA